MGARHALLATLLALWLGPAMALSGAGLEQLWRAARAGEYLAPGGAELARAAALFEDLLNGATGGDPAAAWSRLGYALRPEGDCLVLQERPAARRGRGLFVFCPRRPAGLYLQVPHAYKDLHTGRIGVRLMAEGRFRAAAFNTVPRHYTRDGHRVDADQAHLAVSYFTAFSRALAGADPAARVLQLHGFAQGHRRSAAGARAEMILSDGTARPGPALPALATCLGRGLVAPVLLYPRDVRELGATRNAIAALLRGLGRRGFVHLEMSLAMRQRLLASRAARRVLLDCLAGSPP